MQSMTGYGYGESGDTTFFCSIEIKAVNSRYREVNIKLPRIFLAFEDLLQKRIAKVVERGKLDVYMQYQIKDSRFSGMTLDENLAVYYQERLDALAERLGQGAATDLHQLVLLPGVLTENKERLDQDLVEMHLGQAIDQALAALVEMRQQEGQAIAVDMLGKLADVRQILANIKERSPAVTEEYREKLQNRIANLLKSNVAVDQERLAQEIAYFADKSCIDEEIVRLASHFGQFDQVANAAGSIGRKLDFLLQEMNRETNTIGSKANDGAIGEGIVEMKSLLEKIREQVQNIE